MKKIIFIALLAALALCLAIGALAFSVAPGRELGWNGEADFARLASGDRTHPSPLEAREPSGEYSEDMVAFDPDSPDNAEFDPEGIILGGKLSDEEMAMLDGLAGWLADEPLLAGIPELPGCISCGVEDGVVSAMGASEEGAFDDYVAALKKAGFTIGAQLNADEGSGMSDFSAAHSDGRSLSLTLMDSLLMLEVYAGGADYGNYGGGYDSGDYDLGDYEDYLPEGFDIDAYLGG